jgi:tetrahydromethanopterin S-methyltransferase subunit G
MESRLNELEQKINQISEFFNEINILQIKRNEISNQTTVQFQIIVDDIMNNFLVVKERIEAIEKRLDNLDDKLIKLNEK